MDIVTGENSSAGEQDVGFAVDLRISLLPVMIAIGVFGVITLLLNPLMRDFSDRVTFFIFSVLIILAAVAIWRLERWNLQVAQWVAVGVVVLIPLVASRWLAVPGLLSLLAIPTALAAVIISVPAALITAAIETILLVLPRPISIVAGADTAAIVTALVSIWCILLVMVATYHPVYQVAKWAWEYFLRARYVLEEARRHRAELEQALEDLADANMQLTRMNALAQGLRQAADDARTAKTQFVANVSHELRTPLNMITGFSEMILQSPGTYGGSIPPALLADLAVIQRNAEHLSALIDDVLDLSQVETDQMALTKEHVIFSEVVAMATMAVRPLFESKGLDLSVDMPDDLPPIFCDCTRIREVLLNLLSNAGRFTERGGVHVKACRDKQDLLVMVSDTGPGISQEDLGKLFQPFQQLDGSIRRRYGGTGLGLAISKRFIELHGGSIWVESQKGHGTTFFFRLPIVPSLQIDKDSWRRSHPQWEFFQRTRPWVAPKTVLRPRFVVLETGDDLQRLLHRYMDEVELVLVTSLEEALSELARVPTQALLVNAPSVGEVMEHLTFVTLPSGVPALICAIPGMREASDTLGVSERLVKPISRETLLGTLDQLGLEEGTVLIVDDEPDALHLFGRMLASSGRDYKVLLARDGQEALQILKDSRDGGHCPDVILLDLVMPAMDGFKLLEIRRHDPVLQAIPVVIISARDPAGQPIVSNAMAITRGGGLSMSQLLMTIEFMGRMLTVTPTMGAQDAGLELAETRIG